MPQHYPVFGTTSVGLGEELPQVEVSSNTWSLYGSRRYAASRLSCSYLCRISFTAACASSTAIHGVKRTVSNTGHFGDGACSCSAHLVATGMIRLLMECVSIWVEVWSGLCRPVPPTCVCLHTFCKELLFKMLETSKTSSYIYSHSLKYSTTINHSYPCTNVYNKLNNHNHSKHITSSSKLLNLRKLYQNIKKHREALPITQKTYPKLCESLLKPHET